MAKKRKTSRKKKGKGPAGKNRKGHVFRRALGLTLLLSCLAGFLYGAYLDVQVRRQFEGKRWAIPARVYARPLELYPGLRLTGEQLAQELSLAGYRQDQRAALPGSYDRSGQGFHLVTRSFDFGDSQEPSRRVWVRFEEGQVAAVETESGTPLELLRLDPAQIGSFHPLRHEDRVLVQREEIPERLVQALLAVEDRKFYEHHGIDPQGIVRALWANLRAGRTVQGGSTLTQQLVKNMFLTSERTLWRKFKEAIMAVLLEVHYDKEEILTAYVNEVFLGQDGQRAIHGFGLASRFYFRRNLGDLDLPQLALLAGLVKGPSYYDPRRFPARSRQRRDLVLKAMADRGFLSAAETEQALQASLDQNLHLTGGTTLFPAFVDLVRRRLQENYREEDLTSEGLKIFTTLDPQVQWQAEEALATTMARLTKRTGRRGMEAAVVVNSYGAGEIQALIGSRTAGAPGFNRAVDARRPIGSLIKPAVYLTALQKGYTLGNLLEDTAIEVDNADGSRWTPRNFDQQEHGLVPLHTALARSYNLATVHLGLAVGLEGVLDTLGKLGLERRAAPYPSLLLGALSLSPLEVSQLYQTLAAGGFYTPQRVIRKVLDASNHPLQRFPISVEQRFDPRVVFLVNTMLKEVVSQGTGRSLARYLPEDFVAAGKTGTSDNLRDSWFAGFTGERLAVVWLGMDDNGPLGLTGSSGALVVWGELMRRLGARPLDLPTPAGIEWVWMDPRQQKRVRPGSSDGEYLPFLEGSAPTAGFGSQPASGEGRGWVRQLFEKIF